MIENAGSIFKKVCLPQYAKKKFSDLIKNIFTTCCWHVLFERK